MSKLKSSFILISIITLGLFLRLYHNTDISLWHDEAFSALLIKYSWSEMLYRIGLDVHPPMYYIFLRIWNYILGDSLFALRGFSIFFGLATVVASYAFVKNAFKNSWAALATALLVAINPFQIQYATEARMYTFGAFFLILGAFFLVKALDSQKRAYEGLAIAPQNGREKLKIRLYYILFAVSMATIILTHYYLLFTAAALCFYALAYHAYFYRFNFRRYGLLCMAYVLIAVSFMPWLKTFLFQYKQVGAGYWIPPMDRWSIPSTLWQMAIGIGVDIHTPLTQILLCLVTLLTLYILASFLKKERSPHTWLVVLVFLAPFAGALLFLILARISGQNSSVYLVRYFLYASAFYTIIIAVWLSQLRYKKIAYAITAAYVLLNIGAFTNYWTEIAIAEKPGMNKAAAFLENNMVLGDKLFVGSSFQFFNLKYYVSQMQRTDITRPLLYSAGQYTTENMPHFAGTAILTNDDLVPNFKEATKPGDTVWLVWTNGFGGAKPQTPETWEEVNEHGFAEVRPYVGTWVIITQYIVK